MSKDKIATLQKEIVNNNIDGFIIPSNDEFFSEYTPYYNNRLEYITGFKGSNGMALILKDQAVFFTDGRYLKQAEFELDQSFQIIDIALSNLPKWLRQNSKQNLKIGLDASLHSEQFIMDLCCNVVFIHNLIDVLWKDKPVKPRSKIYSYPMEYSGSDAKFKINKLMNFLSEEKLDHIFITDPASICWLLNIRGEDSEFTPIVNCYLLVSANNILKLFTDSVDDLLLVKKFPLESILDELNFPSSKIAIDKANTAYKFVQLFEKAKMDIINIKNPCLIWKSCKNPVEISNIKQAHIYDGLAICRFLLWFTCSQNKYNELFLIKKLEEFRKLENQYISPSFATICGFNSNGAIIHYRANEETSKIIGKGILLIDSGGQYTLGTTDVTRTIIIGDPTNEQKENFTRVLKGHIRIASGKFPIGTTGSQLDSLARYSLWQIGLDYAHSTGHGVGCYLNVHEGPQYIGKKVSDVALIEGMIISNEPGYYKSGEYGIRIENLLYIKKSSFDGFLEFEDLTMVPLDYNLINFDILNDQEKQWLVEYHQKIHDNLAKLDQSIKKWLKKYVEFYKNKK